MISEYLNQLANELQKGDAREESFYKHLEKLQPEEKKAETEIAKVVDKNYFKLIKKII